MLKRVCTPSFIYYNKAMHNLKEINCAFRSNLLACKKYNFILDTYFLSNHTS